MSEDITKNIRFGSREDHQAVEAGLDFAPKFDASGLITAVAVDAGNGEVLMVAYMNEESLRRTLELGEAVYYSRSRQELWHKGATSGHVQKVVEILADCDQDALVLRVNQQGAGACHTGYRSCFFRSVKLDSSGADGEQPAKLIPVYASKAYDAEAVYRK
ncbi:MAG: phosphoribosyl-AMP cyclohydrolase [Verrucomicrobiales bacterium]|nr:phosphoribosyl-AMP cyclohydrolase [Verrucomicrobiales bacterium]